MQQLRKQAFPNLLLFEIQNSRSFQIVLKLINIPMLKLFNMLTSGKTVEQQPFICVNWPLTPKF